MKLVGLLMTLTLSFQALAQTTAEPCGSCRRFFLSVIATNVKVIPHSKAEVVLKFSKPSEKNTSEAGEVLSQMVLQTNISKDVVEVRAKLPPSKSDWQKISGSAALPLGRLEVFVPATMALELYVNQGDVTVQNWKASISVSSQKGSVTITDVSGDVSARGFLGALKIENVRGAVTVDSFSGHVAVEKVAGKTKVRAFHGDALIKDVKGNMLVASQLSNVTAKDTQGTMEVQGGSSPIKILSHKGILRGQSDAASIDARIVAGSQVRLKSNSGNLSASVPGQSQAQVFLSSTKGDVRAPKSLEANRDGSSRSVRGALGGGGDGVIRLVSDTGSVSLRVN